MNPIKILGTIFKLVVGPLTAQVNEVPKGMTTGLGGVIAGAGVLLGAASGHILTDQNIVEFIKALALVVEAIGTIIIGIGAQRHHVDEQK